MCVWDGMETATLIGAVHSDPRIQAWNDRPGSDVRYMLSWNPHVGEQIKEIDEEQDRDERR